MSQATSNELPAASRRGGRTDWVVRVVAGVYLVALLAVAVAYHALWFGAVGNDVVFAIYGAAVVSYIVGRFAISLWYRVPKDAHYQPKVAIVMPAFNEEEVIGRSLRSLLALDYPEDKLELVAVNDGSTDETLARMRAVAEESPRVRVIDLGHNQGKRAAMAAGMRETDAEILAFVDSDSSVEPDALYNLVQGFADSQVGAICGHADVMNPDDSWLTRMQVVRYFVAFKVVKAAESVFSCVTCCSGCFSAYRRSAILPSLDWWEHQTFLGHPATFGDDRALTNCVLRDWKVLYAGNAVSHTLVPVRMKQFLRQQLRWKRSWTRESLILSRFVWRKNPIAALLAYAGVVMTLISPVIAVRAIIWLPLFNGHGAPYIYIGGIYAFSLAYGLYYLVRRPKYDVNWIFGVAFCFFYISVLLWQQYWAILTARSSDWGTRPATAGIQQAPEPAELAS